MVSKPLNPTAQLKLLKKMDEICKFAPTDGICWTCNKNIYDLIVIEEDMPEITSCPYCQASFVE